MVWVSGGFHVIGGVWHPFAAALDPETGAVLPWNPEPDDFVEALVLGDGAIQLGGTFTYVDELPVGSFALAPALGAPLPPRAFPGPRLSLRQNTPDPAFG